MTTKTINVEGMSCGHCVKTIEDNVQKIEGVHDVSVNLESGNVQIGFDDNKVNIKKITDVIEDQGFDVKA